MKHIKNEHKNSKVIFLKAKQLLLRINCGENFENLDFKCKYF